MVGATRRPCDSAGSTLVPTTGTRQDNTPLRRGVCPCVCRVVAWSLLPVDRNHRLREGRISFSPPADSRIELQVSQGTLRTHSYLQTSSDYVPPSERRHGLGPLFTQPPSKRRRERGWWVMVVSVSQWEGDPNPSCGLIPMERESALGRYALQRSSTTTYQASPLPFR
jgi:hypothetical protein